MRGSECGLSLHMCTNVGGVERCCRPATKPQLWRFHVRQVSESACREWKAASSNSFDHVCTSSHLIDWSHSGGIFIVPC